MALRTSRFLCGMLAVAGTAHFTSAEHFDRIVPRVLPGDPRLYTHVSGVAELVIAGMLAVPRTRRAGGVAAIALFVAVFPANVQMALDSLDSSPARRAVAWGRLPLQAVLIAQGAHVARAETP